MVRPRLYNSPESALKMYENDNDKSFTIQSGIFPLETVRDTRTS
jgi:hypothetical protein